MMPYGDIDLGQQWLRWWLGAWRHQAITWTNVDLSSQLFSSIPLWMILQEKLMNLICYMYSKFTHLKSPSNLSEVDELTYH